MLQIPMDSVPPPPQMAKIDFFKMAPNCLKTLQIPLKCIKNVILRYFMIVLCHFDTVRVQQMAPTSPNYNHILVDF